MITRDITHLLQQHLQQGWSVFLSGSRLAGKSTLVRTLCADYEYINFADPDTRLEFDTNPEQFFNRLKQKVVIDDVHRQVDFWEHLTADPSEVISRQYVICSDRKVDMSQIEIGSKRLSDFFVEMSLFPYSINELMSNGINDDYDHLLPKGFFPGQYLVSSPLYLQAYISGYLENELPQVKSLNKQSSFYKLMKLCAASVGQLINMSEWARECGVSVNTIKSWLQLLEDSYVVFFLQPHYQSFKKRLVKVPKLYFLDTGVLMHLLNVRSLEQVNSPELADLIFENFVVAEFVKSNRNLDSNFDFYFWRDSKGKEVDFLIEKNGRTIPVEIKAGKDANNVNYKGLKYWRKLSGSSPENTIVIYGGSETRKTPQGLLLSWRNMIDFVTVI